MYYVSLQRMFLDLPALTILILRQLALTFFADKTYPRSSSIELALSERGHAFLFVELSLCILYQPFVVLGTLASDYIPA